MSVTIEKRQISYNITARYGSILYIVVHDTGNCGKGANADSHYNYFNTGNRSSSADVFVDDTKAIQVNDFNKYYTWHCGDGHGKYGITNANSIGIEMCINSDGDYDKALENTIEVVKYYMKLLGIDAAHVVRHYDASRKNCPQSFNKNGWARWIEFKRRLNESEDLTVTQYEELNKKIEALETKVGKQNEVYNYIDDNMPYGQEETQWAKDRKIIVGDEKGNLGLSPIKIWTLCIVVRTAKYLAKLMGIKM